MEWLKLITAPSRLEILRVLFTAKAPLRLRTIASLTKASLRPVQLALPQLVNGGLIKKKHINGFDFYEIAELPYPLEIFLAAINDEILKLKAKLKADDALSLGPFQEDAFKMIQNRKS